MTISTEGTNEMRNDSLDHKTDDAIIAEWVAFAIQMGERDAIEPQSIADASLTAAVHVNVGVYGAQYTARQLLLISQMLIDGQNFRRN